MTSALSSDELDAIRTDVETLVMPSTCTIQTVTRTSDGMGGYTEAWANTYTGVICRLMPMASDTSRQDGDQFGVVAGYVLTVEWDQDIAPGYRVIFSSDTYEVLRVNDDHDFRTARRAELRRID